MENIWYAGKEMVFRETLIEDELGNWDDRHAQLMCDFGGCVIHEGEKHHIFMPKKEAGD